MGLKITAMLLVAALASPGCVVSARHHSNPTIDNDGANLACGGLEQDWRRLSVRGELCHNLTPATVRRCGSEVGPQPFPCSNRQPGDNQVLLSIEYRPFKR